MFLSKMLSTIWSKRTKYISIIHKLVERKKVVVHFRIPFIDFLQLNICYFPDRNGPLSQFIAPLSFFFNVQLFQYQHVLCKKGYILKLDPAHYSQFNFMLNLLVFSCQATQMFKLLLGGPHSKGLLILRVKNLKPLKTEFQCLVCNMIQYYTIGNIHTYIIPIVVIPINKMAQTDVRVGQCISIPD